MGRDDAALRALRPPKLVVDPETAHGVVDEVERTTLGRRHTRTVFLTGAECPFTCVFCDLWQYTLDGPTPAGAIPRQLAKALDPAPEEIDDLKLYNASNFFDPRAVPTADHAAIARLVRRFDRVVVECHPKLVDSRCRDFAARLDGRLEIAMGLETAHPRALAQLNKRMTREDFARATDFGLAAGFDLRAFVLVGAPGVPAAESDEWVQRTLAFAFSCGVGHAVLIPVRPGPPSLDAPAEQARFRAPDLTTVEACFEMALQSQSVGRCVTLDTWDLEQLDAAACCRERRLGRLRAINDRGSLAEAISCDVCAA